MIPSKQQWNKWSLPSKYGAVSLAIAVVTAAIMMVGWVSNLVTDNRSARTIQYEIASVESLTRAEARSTVGDGFEPFNFQLDDPIVDRYLLYRVRLKNTGDAVETPLQLTIQLSSSYTKIIDFQHRLKTPQNKSITVTSSLPNLQWTMPEMRGEFTLKWQAQDEADSIAGFNIYSSLLPTHGFGRLNPSLLETTEVKIFWSGGTRYYSVTVVSIAGLESDRPSPVRLPEHLAFLPSFENVYWIDIATEHETTDGSSRKRYPSLERLLEAQPEAVAAIVETGTMVDPGLGRLQILSPDDFAFLDGRLGFTVPGLDEGAEIELAILAKSVSEDVPKLVLRLDDAPGITMTEGRNSLRHYPVETIKPNPRALFTPEAVVTRSAKNAVFLELIPRSGHSIGRVRVFRSSVGALQDLVDPGDDSLGDEIYDGPPVAMNLRCRPEAVRTGDSGANWWRRHMKGVLDPPPRGPPDPRAPESPTLVVVGNFQEPSSIKSKFIADVDVDQNTIYRYTIFVEDDVSGKYSYPLTTFSTPNLPDPLLCEAIE